MLTDTDSGADEPDKTGINCITMECKVKEVSDDQVPSNTTQEGNEVDIKKLDGNNAFNSLKYLYNSDKLIKLTVTQIQEQFGFNFIDQLSAKERAIPDIKFDDELISVMVGKDFDLSKVGIKKHVPSTTQFMIYECRSEREPRRVIRLLCCTHPNCSKVFRKWHNFFDHLRIHTNERPYACPMPKCMMRFTQKANLNKHLDIHLGVKRFACSYCFKRFYTRYNLNVSTL